MTGIPSEGENLIEAVQLRHAMATLAATIASRLHIDQATVLHVIQHGILPQRQMTLLCESTRQGRMHTEAVLESEP